MKAVVRNLGVALKLMKDDKKLLMLSMIPVLIGVLCFLGLGTWIYTSVLASGTEWVEGMVGDGGWGKFLHYVIVGILTITMFFVVNWGFVIFVSVIASPFNDIISSRTERLVQGKVPEDVTASFKAAFGRILKTLLNEIKKISFIIFLTIAAFLISLFPLLVPVSVAIYALLLAFQFLDYSWCRHNLKLGKCLKDIKGSLIPYLLGGGFFLLLMSVPIVNVLSLPVAVVFFTTLFTEHRSSDDLLES